MKQGLVSIIIPTKNSSNYLLKCLEKIGRQKYRNTEVVIVEGKSKDRNVTRNIAKDYGCKFITYIPKVKNGLFDATVKRNYAARQAIGEFIYHFDADMELTKNVLKEAVDLCRKNFDAVIMTEDSYGIGPWARAKNLERRFFWGDDHVESPRFFKKSIWEKLHGYDANIAGGGDDRDLYQRMLEMGYKAGRTKNLVMHNEGKLTLWYLMKKQFMYKREVLKYIRKRPGVAFQSFFPIRRGYFTNWSMLASRPVDSILLAVMKSFEILAGLGGMTYSLFE